MAETEGVWAIHTVDGAEVRLRSGRIGLVKVDVRAPVSGGELTVRADEVRLTLHLALDQMRTSIVMQAAARSIVTRHDARVLTYDGTGTNETPWQVSGHAAAGTIDIRLSLMVTACGADADLMSEIELVGTANLGTVHLPLPGLGTVDDFSFDVDARLALRPLR
jgi:hypothetical protein